MCGPGYVRYRLGDERLDSILRVTTVSIHRAAASSRPVSANSVAMKCSTGTVRGDSSIGCCSRSSAGGLLADDRFRVGNSLRLGDGRLSRHHRDGGSHGWDEGSSSCDGCLGRGQSSLQFAVTASNAACTAIGICRATPAVLRAASSAVGIGVWITNESAVGGTAASIRGIDRCVTNGSLVSTSTRERCELG